MKKKIIIFFIVNLDIHGIFVFDVKMILLALFGLSSFFLQSEHNLIQSSVQMHLFLQKQQLGENLLVNACLEDGVQSFLSQEFPAFQFFGRAFNTSQEVRLLADIDCKH